MKQIDERIQIQKQFADLQKEHFFESILFSYQWWILIATIVILWIIWLLVVEKKRLKVILIVGLITSMMAIVLDDIGLSVAAWFYPYQVVYFTTRLNAVDLAVIPVSYMLLYQYFRSWKRYLLATVIFCLFAAFIAEPIFVQLNMYKMMRWEYWYSFPIYMAMGVFVKWLVDKIERKYG